jgi:hypothetical protein
MSPTPRRARSAPPGSKPTIAASIPDHLFTSPPFRALGVAERWLIVEMIARKGRVDKLCRQNGRKPDDIIGCSVREAANMLGVSKSHAGRALAALCEAGFIAEVREASKGPKRRGTSTGWRLIFMPFRGEPPTLDYLKIADRAARQDDAERVAGEPFFIPGMDGYAEPSNDEEVSRPWDSFAPESVPPVGRVSN